MKLSFNHTIIFLIVVLAFNSCALFKPKCPIPNCNIGQEHQHNLIFDKKAMKENEKKRKGEAKEFNKEQEEASLDGDDALEVDSLSLAEGVGNESDIATLDEGEGANNDLIEEEPSPKKKEKRKKKNEDIIEDGEVNPTLGNSSEELEASSNKKTKKKKRSKDEEDQLDDATLEAMSVGNDTAAVDDAVDNTLSKKEIREIEKNTESELTQTEKEAKRIEDELQKSWRSRITAWFKKNQKPKIGEHWKGPVKRKDVPDFRIWPKVRVWPFDKEKVYTKY